MFQDNTLNNIEDKYNLAINLFQSEKYNESEKVILELLNIVPDNSDIYNFYGRLKQFQGQFDKSIELLKKSVSINNSNFMAHYNLGLAYCIKKDLKNVKHHFEQYLEHNTDNNNKYTCNLYISKLHFDELDITETAHYYKESKIPLFVELSKLLVPRIYTSVEHIQENRELYYNTLNNLLNSNIDNLIIHSPEVFSEYLQFIYCYVFPLSYQGQNNSLILKKQCELYRKLFPCLNYTSKYLDTIKIHNNKIKIGFISTNFFNQSVSRDRMGIIRNLPRELFEVVVFFYFKPNDDLGNFIWDSDNINIVLPDTNIFERRHIIEEQKLNILIYCDIGMAPDTYFLSYSRLAPIQCNTWGHSDTSGIDTIDYYLSSVYYEKDTNPEQNYSEKLVLMNSLCTYYYKIIENPTFVNKNYFGFSEKTNIYLSSQVLFKLNPEYDNVINNILNNDPNGIVVFIKMNLGSYIQDILIQRLENTLQENMTRFHLIEWQTSERDFYKLLSIADVIIDPYPFGGCNTSFSAFSMGIPIVTMPAEMINGRFTYGLYKKMDVMDLVAYNFEDYVKLANKCATNKLWRNEISQKIKDNIHLIFNEIDSINTWINFCIEAVNKNINTNPVLIDNTNKYENNSENNSENNIENNSENNSEYQENTKNIPKIIHFIYFGYTDFKFVHYFAIKTAYDNNPSYKINLYNYKLPKNNIWFDLTLQYVNIIHTEPPESIYGNKLNTYAHRADIVRLEKLIEYGGFYLDIDVWTLKSFDSLLNIEETCIMGYQAEQSQFKGLCNAVVGAKPQSAFLKIWLENYKSFKSDEWDKHSVYLPLELSKDHPSLIHIKSQEVFFPVSWFDFNDLFKKNKKVNLDNSYTIHLWESHTMDLLLNKLNPLYFNLYNTSLVNYFKNNILDYNKPKILLILEDNNNLDNIKQLLYILLAYGYDISLQYLCELNTNVSINNYILNIKDDYDLLINKLYEKKSNENKTYEYVLTNFDTNLLNNIINNSIPKLNINSINIPHTLLKSQIQHKNDYNHSLYDMLEECYICIYSDNIIQINNNYIENFKCMPLNNVKSDKFVYTIIGDISNIYNILDAYYSLFKKHSNILIYIISPYNNDIFKHFQNITEKYTKHKILFNFNNLTSKSFEKVYNRSNCYIDINNNDYKFNFVYYKKPVILFNKNNILTNAFYINNNESNISDQLFNTMNNIYENYNNINNLLDTDYINLSDNFISNSKLIDNILNKKINSNNTEIINNTHNSKSMNISNTKKEILCIGKFKTFANRMDTLYYEFLEHLKFNSDYKIVFVDSTSCIVNKPINYYIDTYCTTDNPIIYSIVYTQENEQIISDLDSCKFIKIYEIEDCYEVDNLINNINKFKYDYVIYRYNCEQMQYIISKCNCKFIHMPHYINSQIFTKYNNEKTIDILLYGNTSNFYPFRQRLFKLIKNSGLNYYYLQHPGYDTTVNIKTKSDLSKLINKSRITISTCSSFNYFLKKYIEISLSGSVIAGNFPHTEENLYKNCMCLLDETDSDDIIIEKLKNILSLSNKDYNMIIDESYNISMNNYTYDQSLIRFNKIINYICENDTINNDTINNDTINNDTINNDTINNQIFSYIYDNKIWNEGNGGSGEGSSIDNNIDTYIPFLKNFINEYQIKKIVDLGCGDWQSSHLIYKNINIEYYGYDIYKKLVDENKKKYPKYNFIYLDFIENKHILENADLCIIKDVLQHLNNQQINDLLIYLTKTKKYKYILINNCCNQDKDNSDINTGDWRPLTALKKPLSNYNPSIIYKYLTKEVSVISLI